jgi:hypothetical protein
MVNSSPVSGVISGTTAVDRPMYCSMTVRLGEA